MAREVTLEADDDHCITVRYPDMPYLGSWHIPGTNALPMSVLHPEHRYSLLRTRLLVLFIRTLKKQSEVLDEWNDTIWTVMVEKAIIHKDGKITFVFQNGMEIKTTV